ncbi:MAG: HAD-IC family P-type ATPase, partial [Verrucomicrobiota bacterium]
LKGARLLDEIFASIEQAEERPSELQEQADAITRWFLPVVVVVSLGTFGAWMLLGTWQQALFNAMAVILVACPCALGLATPIAVWGGLFRLSRLGMVSRSGRLIDALSKTRRIFFDKTGTLSESSLRVVDFLVPDGGPAERGELLRWVELAESQVTHPVARALARFAGRQLPETAGAAPARGVAGGLRVRAGLGLEASIDGATGSMPLLIGELDLMPPGIRGELADLAHASPAADAKKRVFIALDGQAAGVALLDEELRSGVEPLIRQLSAQGIESMILTGDLSPKWAEIEGVKVEPGLSPLEKEEAVRASAQAGEMPLFIGDGTNDTPAMAAAAASMAMHEGAALARASADATLADHALGNLPEAVATAREVRRSLKGNLLFAACYNIIGMSLAACGLLHPVVAALLMVVSSILVSSRAARSVRVKTETHSQLKSA